MPNILAISSEGDLSPSFDLRFLAAQPRKTDGWGLGYYPGEEPAAVVLKEHSPVPGSRRSEIARGLDHLDSRIFLLHLRRAAWGKVSAANTQPLLRSWGGRDWMFVHAGSLEQKLDRSSNTRFEAVGATDSEAIFCELLERLAARGWKSLQDADVAELHAWFSEWDALGNVSCVVSDGTDVCVYSDREGERPLWLWTLKPPFNEVAFGDTELGVDLSRRGAKSRKTVFVSDAALTGESGPTPSWEAVAPGTLVVLREAAVIRRFDGGGGDTVSDNETRRRRLLAPAPVEVQQLRVEHRTHYRYANPVERSTHLLRLHPMHDRQQRVLASSIDVSVDGDFRDYDDVFGNRVRRMVIERSFEEMDIVARSLVEVRDSDPWPLKPLRARSTFPLVWMPWQRHMMQPYMLPPELPESQLHELVEYAMSFVARNDGSLIDVLFDLNDTIFREYAYQQGTTTNYTSAFNVYVNRRGVCQDFTNLMICLTRLLGLPARYVCGYVYTGPKNPNQVQSEASHAWVEVYLPEIGWRGLDPTNGIVVRNEHVRVAHGRTWTDATPTSGTIYAGGGSEIMTVNVKVDVEDNPA